MSIFKTPASHLAANAVRYDAQYKKLSESLAGYKIKNFRQAPSFVTGMGDTLSGIVIASLMEEISEIPEYRGTNLVIAPDERTAAYLVKVLSCMTDGVMLFPMRDFVFHNVEAFSHESEYERLDVLRKISDGTCRAVVAVPEAVLSLLPPQKNCAREIEISVGNEYSVTKLLEELCLFGYAECDTVEGKGQFSHRGDIVDIFPPDADLPIRVEFFGDEVDACGYFDVLTQRRTENLQSFTVTPSRELLISPEQRDVCLTLVDELIAAMEKRLGKAKKSGEKTDVLTYDTTLSKLRREKEMLSEGTLPNIDKYLPALSSDGDCLLSRIRGGIFAVDYPKITERIKSCAWQLNENILSLISAGELHHTCTDFMHGEDVLISRFSRCPTVVTSAFTSHLDFEISGLYSFVSKQTASVGTNYDVLFDDIENYNALGYKTVLCTRDSKTASEYCTHLQEKGLAAQVCAPNGVFSDEARGGMCYCTYDMGDMKELRGFELSKTSFALLTEGENILAKRSVRGRKPSPGKSSGQKILSYQDLRVGDYVVHTVHGIARYEGLKTLTVDGLTRDYVMLQYAGSDALYIPIDQMDRISKYAGAADTVKLSSMSSKDWQKTKARAKKAARDMAKQLIQLYAERTKLAGYAFSPDTEWQKDFEADFEYEETDGQLAAISEIKTDMEKPHPMDRLLCGDVGFGKTEVSLRAVFKCVIEGKQAAILVPTTILAMQHYQTVLSRMKGFPLKIEMLSRFCKPKEAAAIVKRLATGETDIVIGTHKLLGKNIKFKDLGLLVVDEEQRFGVAHKERLKEISKQIDVLTLTATPIPRTLNMAMAGIRDMSVLEEAPTDRYPVQTYVLEYDNFIILEAIKKELRRAGQVFYMRNRVEGIEETAAKLRAALPDASIACAHGKMSQEELSDIWASLVAGEIDILVCTTIIETGIDVPNANTLIIEDADKLGLAQLHQIRGRIGRSNRRAYAYITWKKSAALTEIATKRLDALREFTEFGSGFRIAMRDLEIRGAGNILGAEQSGHMEAVGYELYIRILEEAVLEEKGIVPGSSEESACTLDLRVNAYIPEKYIRLPASRIEMYKKIAAAKTREDIDEIRDEMLDRYGNIPRETEALCEISLLRARCENCGIKKIEQRENKLIIYPVTVEKSTAVSLSLYFKGRVLLSMGNFPCYNIKLLPDENVLELAGEFVTQTEKLMNSEKASKPI
ncbi:MAG: transcription-repair coupling factor [Clostridia bacterium]|nr:transcription-repair coupling factor [Clostridia bacterium]